MTTTATPPAKNPRNVWGLVLKIIIAVASAIAGALGMAACNIS